MPKTHVAKPSLPLWRALRVVAWLYVALSLALAGLFGFRAVILGGLPGDLYITEMDPLPGADWELWTTGAVGVALFLALIVGAVMTLMWYLRSVRNAHALGQKLGTSPAWVVWFFIIPFISLWKPYSVTSELWRSTREPDRWKAVPDSPLVRGWWGLVLIGNILSTIGSAAGRNAQSAAALMVSDAVLGASALVLGVAGVLFIRIAGPISLKQTALIERGWTQQTSGSAWAP